MSLISTSFSFPKLILPLLGIIFFEHSLPAQLARLRDDIYFADESSVNVSLVDVSSKKIRYINESNKVKSISTEKVLMISNKAGEFLVFPDDNITSMRADNFIKGNHLPPSDLIITVDSKMAPVKVLSKSERDIVFTMKSEGTEELSISKEKVAAIIYSEGNYELLVSPQQAMHLFKTLAPSIQNFRLGMPVDDVAFRIRELKTPEKPEANSTSSNDPAILKAGNTVVSSQVVSPETSEKEKSLSAIDMELFTKKALQKTKELSNYLTIISDKSSEYQRANKAIDQACRLFISEESRVEVSSGKEQDNKISYKIRDYLKRLKLLKYDRVEILWSNINYVSNFHKGTDGNYYGVISLQQKFKGFMDGKMVYTDEVRKNLEVIIKGYEKELEGQTVALWDVFLSDIGIVASKKDL